MMRIDTVASMRVSEGPMIVAICLRFDHTSPYAPFKDADALPLLRAIQARMRHVRFLGLDWRTATRQGYAVAYDLRNGICRVDMSDIQIVHVLHLGYGTNKALSLRDKWKEVNDKVRVMTDYGINVINPAESIAYGIDKVYLSDLVSLGLPMIETLRLPSCVSLDIVRKQSGSRYQIIKPANGECGKLVRHVSTLTSEILANYRLECDDLLLQPFAQEIALGEKSLIYLGSRFLHAVRKVPSSSDFRANGYHTGAHVYPYKPTDAEFALADSVRNCFPHPIHTFRLDLVGENANLRIMEIEAVDPNHYCAITESYIDALADFYTERAAERGH